MMRAAPAVLAIALGAGSALAREVPVLRARVTDEAGVLGGRAADLDRKLADYERDTGHQLAVLVLRSLEGDVLESFSMRVADKWRLGDSRRDDGLLVIVAVEDRAARIEVGYGLEGAVPDAIAGRVMREQMTPRFADGDYAGGIEAGLDALMRAAKGESLGPPPRGRPREDNSMLPSLVGVALASLTVLVRIRRTIRVPIAILIGGVIGFAVFSSLMTALLCALGAGLLTLVLPTMSAGARGGLWLGRSSSSWGGSRGGFGGFSGGGGGFGGGGASGRW